jgi:glycine/D-amino acid oxidase-like deaminating enzyme
VKKQSLWLDTSDPPAFPKLQGRVTADVVVVGGGITGLTTAYLLKKAGCRVAVLDQRSIGGGETAHTTAHVTFVTDTRLHELASAWEEASPTLWGAGHLAMKQIEDISELEIHCELKQVPGYLFAAVGKDIEEERETLQRDAG